MEGKTMRKKVTRRIVLLRGMQVPLGGAVLLGLGSCGGNSGNGNPTPCAGSEAMGDAEMGLRTSLQYTAHAPDPQAVCADCVFFTPAVTGGCGMCEIIGGQVSREGHCTSWSAKT